MKNSRQKHPINKIRIAFILLLLFPAIPQDSGAAPKSEQLIVFVQPGKSPVDDAFVGNSLPEIKKLAESMGVDVHVVNATRGSPEAVAVTPLMVFQNHRGRSIYQGRTTTPARIRNFIRTSRFVPQGEELNRRQSIPVWSRGRSRIWSPLKVSAVTGSQPENYREESFIKDALTQIEAGFKKFEVLELVELGRADRGFYMDFYPWLGRDNTLFVSLALFSQFDCKEPVFTEKIIGPWSRRAELFRKAAVRMEDAVARIVADPDSGDSFDPVDRAVPMKDWQQIGFALPPAPKLQASQKQFSATVPQKWALTPPGPDDPPMILFRFPAPLDNYAGEVKSGRGEVVLSDDRKVEGTQGFVEIDTRSAINMGDARLNEAIRGSMMLYTKKFPFATFKVEKVSGDGRPISYGRLSPAVVEGVFELKGKSIPLTSMAEIEPILGEDGKPRLLIYGNFKIDLRTFDIEGADGPAPARHTLLFNLNLILQEKSMG